ncbi:zinc finger protein 713 isoform X4 [Nycticebus coucang]|uniref:zinc finger protein 713 isoform X4 n=1 Tax=Nycticebus coucang TaxID=9470 RepID=UPI00234DE266|nr:zinc finger protein 713 isoform X4 [Nycticebus coucang]
MWDAVGPWRRRRMRIGDPKPARRGRHCGKAVVRAGLAGGWSSPRGPGTWRHWLRHQGPQHPLPPGSGLAAATGRRRRQGAEPPGAPFVRGGCYAFSECCSFSGRDHEEERNECWITDSQVPGITDIPGCGCGLHQRGVGPTVPCSEEPLPRCDAGELQESSCTRASTL